MTKEEEALKIWLPVILMSVEKMPECKEALEMATKALEQKPKIIETIDFAINASDGDTNYFVGFRNGMRYIKSLIDGKEPQFESCAEPKTDGDCISRAEAIYLADELKHDLPDNDKVADEVMAHNEAILEYQTKLSLLPSVNPKTGWIPVSGRLPENKKDVIALLSSGRVTKAQYNYHKLPFSNEPIGWGYVNKEGYIDFLNEEVIAWMPLPEYKEG